MKKRSGGWMSTVITVGSFLLLAWIERRRPLRPNVEPKLRREGRNVGIAGASAIALQLAGAPIVRPLTRIVERRRWGLLNRVRLPRWLEITAALLLMDYTFYLWHVLTHKTPALWRFHIAHHSDLDLDASTALRFHFGELLAGVPWQAAQIVLFGLKPFTYSVWQTVFLIAILFHHSDVRLPIAWEQRLNWFIVTPRMHGIHHSVVERESNSNWSSGLSIWDRLHGTLRLNVPQLEVTIGVPAFSEPQSLTSVISMPFHKLPPSWHFPDGTQPQQHAEIASRAKLLA